MSVSPVELWNENKIPIKWHRLIPSRSLIFQWMFRRECTQLHASIVINDESHISQTVDILSHVSVCAVRATFLIIYGYVDRELPYVECPLSTTLPKPTRISCVWRNFRLNINDKKCQKQIFIYVRVDTRSERKQRKKKVK